MADAPAGPSDAPGTRAPGPRELVGKALLVVASLVLCLGALEGLARFGRARVTGKGALTVDRYMDPDPLLGWKKRPGASVAFVEPEYKTQVVINSHGLRDPERGYVPKTPSTVRILALGDSFVEGYGVPLAETVTQVLEGSLARGGCEAEVLNGGTAGYSTDQEYLFYRTEGVRYAPRVVVLFFYFNDVVYNARPLYSSGDPKPLLVPDGPGLRVANAPLPPPRPAPAAVPESGPPRGGSALLEWVAGRLRRSSPALYNQLARLGLWAPVQHKPPPEQYGVFRRTASPEVKEAWSQTALILGALDREVQDHGARLLVVYVPSRMEVEDRSWAATQFEYGMKDSHWDRGAVLERLHRITEALHVPVLDLTPPLRAVAHGLLGGPYYVLDGHWNREGHAVAAEELARVLKSDAWLGSCAHP